MSSVLHRHTSDRFPLLVCLDPVCGYIRTDRAAVAAIADQLRIVGAVAPLRADDGRIVRPIPFVSMGRKMR